MSKLKSPRWTCNFCHKPKKAVKFGKARCGDMCNKCFYLD